MSSLDLKFEENLPEFSKDQELESGTESTGSYSLLNNNESKLKKTFRRFKRKLCSKAGLINLSFVLLFVTFSYFYFVPLTNFTTSILFPDTVCSFWSVCYFLSPSQLNNVVVSEEQPKSNAETSKIKNILPGFVTFCIIQFCLTTFIFGTYLLISGLWTGYPFRYDNRFIIRDFAWYDIESNKKYRCGKTTGSRTFTSSFILYLISLFSFLFVIGIFGGRLAANEYVPECKIYRNTALGFGGCLLDEKYVGTIHECRKCAFIGMSMTTLPVLLFILLAFGIFMGIWKLRLWMKFRKRQNELNLKYRTYQDMATTMSQTESQRLQIDGLDTISNLNKKYGISYSSSKDLENNPYHVKREVCFICNLNAVEVTIGCGHAACFSCAFSLPSCPTCKQRYRYSDIQDLI